MARKNVTFDLGYVPAQAALASRRLVVTKMRLAGMDSAPAASYDTTSSGTTDSVTMQLKDNFIYQAVLIDTKTSGEVAEPQVLNFHTGSNLFPGPVAQGKLGFRILAIEDLSSSSDSSLNSSSSSSNSSSVSSASSNSSSVSSASSASSINSSSSSASSINSSSSSASSINSSSSSSSNSSSSSSSHSSSSNSSSSSS